MILEKLEDEMRWDKAFANSQDALAQLASEAMAEYEYKEGKTFFPIFPIVCCLLTYCLS
jgi:hypothetical protein